jgi:hypothetical protein
MYKLVIVLPSEGCPKKLLTDAGVEIVTGRLFKKVPAGCLGEP